MEPAEGYSVISKQYADYHRHLDSFDKGEFQKFLPRSLDGLSIVDLGAGDGRMYKFFSTKNVKKYLSCDICPELLSLHPMGQIVETKVFDLNNAFPVESDSFDLAIVYFVLEHIEDLQNFFSESYRIVKKGGKIIVGHFHQRRARLWTDSNNQSFKIASRFWRLDNVIDIMKYNFRDTVVQPIVDRGVEIGHIIIGTKK